MPLLHEAWALRHNITVADALYVVLARRLAAPLITDDARLTRSPDLRVQVLTADSPSSASKLTSEAAPSPAHGSERPGG